MRVDQIEQDPLDWTTKSDERWPAEGHDEDELDGLLSEGISNLVIDRMQAKSDQQSQSTRYPDLELLMMMISILLRFDSSEKSVIS